MDDLGLELDILRRKYRENFVLIAQDIKNEIDELKPSDLSGEIFDKFEANSSGKIWQDKTLKFFDEILSNEIPENISKIKEFRNSCNCLGCGVCCRFACSEFSPEELKSKAENGDNFAKQFTQIFVPYNSLENVKKIFPQYLKMLEEKNESGYYFYHCPKVTSDNRCPDYENRPQICRDFPDNPLAFLPLECGFKLWKKNSEDIALKLNATSEIINFYKNKIKEKY